MMESLSLYCKDNHRKFDAEFVDVKTARKIVDEFDAD